MTLVATSTPRQGNWLKHEYGKDWGYCRGAVVVNEPSAVTYTTGLVLGKTLVSGSAATVAGTGNTGNGTIGTVTVGASALVGEYVIRFTAATAFEVRAAAGNLVGTGSTGSAVTMGGLTFTITAGGTAFVAGDVINVFVTGTEKYKICKATATDGSQIPAAIFAADGLNNTADLSVDATTDTTVNAIVRGHAIVAKEALTLDSSFDTAAKKNAVYARLTALAILVETQI